MGHVESTCNADTFLNLPMDSLEHKHFRMIFVWEMEDFLYSAPLTTINQTKY